MTEGVGFPEKHTEGKMFDFLSKKDRTPPVLPEGTVRRRYTITGQVQGVGFRYRAPHSVANATSLPGRGESVQGDGFSGGGKLCDIAKRHPLGGAVTAGD